MARDQNLEQDMKEYFHFLCRKFHRLEKLESLRTSLMASWPSISSSRESVHWQTASSPTGSSGENQFVTRPRRNVRGKDSIATKTSKSACNQWKKVPSFFWNYTSLLCYIIQIDESRSLRAGTTATGHSHMAWNSTHGKSELTKVVSESLVRRLNVRFIFAWQHCNQRSTRGKREQNEAKHPDWEFFFAPATTTWWRRSFEQTVAIIAIGLAGVNFFSENAMEIWKTGGEKQFTESSIPCGPTYRL